MNIPYKGFLFLGGMLVGSQLQVLEFNARLGDPEAESLLTAIGQPIFSAILSGNTLPTWDTLAQSAPAAVTIALVDEAYPEAKRDEYPIGIDSLILGNDAQYYASSVIDQGGTLWSNGGRVLYLTATKPNLADAVATVYRKVPCVSFEGMHYRKDIGKKWL